MKLRRWTIELECEGWRKTYHRSYIFKRVAKKIARVIENRKDHRGRGLTARVTKRV